MADLSKSDTTRGLNVQGIPKMQEAIRAYKSTIQKKLNEAFSYGSYQKTINQAIKGSGAQASLKKKMDNIKAKEAELVRQLDKWDTFLDNLKADYTTQDSKFTF